MRMPLILNHHAATVLAKCEETGEFLLGQYDPGYPGKKHWIGRVKLLGGNYFSGKDTEVSPYETYSREISEELSGEKAAAEEMSAAQEHKFASKSDIGFVRNALLKASPHQDCQDYLGTSKPDSEDKPPRYFVQSVFYASLSRDVIECVKSNLYQGKSLTNEGFLTVKTLDEMVSGTVMAQGITGLIIGDMEGVKLPHCLVDGFAFAPIGSPRGMYSDYMGSFAYRDHSKK